MQRGAENRDQWWRGNGVITRLQSYEPDGFEVCAPGGKDCNSSWRRLVTMVENLRSRWAWAMAVRAA